MPAIGFQKQFVMPILTGIKTSTIRKPRKDGRMPCKSGDIVKLYYAMRTKQCELISEVRCKCVGTIKIYGNPFKAIFMDDEGFIAEKHLITLARMEGFPTRTDMRDWFIKHHKIDQHPFTGWHIQWEAR